MLIIARVFATFFSVLVIARSFIDYKAKKESLQMTIFWIVVWATIIAISFWPNLIQTFINFTGGERTGLGTVFGMAIIFLLFVSYRVYVKANRIEKMVGRIVRDLALKDMEKGRK